MGDVYQQLAELCDRATSLSCRLHFQTQTFNTPSLQNENKIAVLFQKDIEYARKQICKNFHTVLEPDQLRAKKYLAVFAKHATDVYDVLQPAYNLFMEMLAFRDETISVLSEVMVTTSDFIFGTNTDLTEKLLGLVTRFVKLHLLLSPQFQKFDEKGIDPKDIVILYQTAALCQKGTRDNGIVKLKAYVEKFCTDDTVAAVKTEFDNISDMVGEYLLRYHDILVQLITKESTQEIVRSGAFNFNDRIEILGKPVDSIENYPGSVLDQDQDTGGKGLLQGYYNSAKFYLDITYLSEIKDWVFFGLLACPSVLGSRSGEKAIAMLKLVASDGWRLRVFRDKILDMHEVWVHHFKFLKKIQSK